MGEAELWIVGGPNGAGKTTVVQREPIERLLAHVRFLNPDDRTLERLRASGIPEFRAAPETVLREAFVASAEEVQSELELAIAGEECVGVESVLSTEKYVALIDSVLAAGGRFFLVYVALNSPALAIRRVAARVERGGHGVPPDRIAARWHRSLSLLPTFASKATRFWILDNSSSDSAEPMKLVAEGRNGHLVSRETTFPDLESALDAMATTDEAG